MPLNSLIFPLQFIHVTCDIIFGTAESFPGFSITIIFDGLHTLGICFSVKHTFSIECSHL